MTSGGFDQRTRIDWLRLSRTPRVGPVTFAQLLYRFGNASAALDGLVKLAAEKGRPRPAIPPHEKISAELDQIRNYGGSIVCSAEPEYPTFLKAMSPPPPVLTYIGDLSLGTKPTVAIVGARDASAVGRKLARDIAAQLSVAGFVTVSGMARGIDGEVHAASLKGGTIAVLGGGIDHLYPPQHERLYAAIAESGLIVSESPFGYRATAKDFPRRNRIITGLSAGVVVVEAAERSGSLISARMAGEQGREVMAVPGSPLDPRAAGTNRLLRDGATLVRNADDVIEALNSMTGSGMRAPPASEFASPTGQDHTIPDRQIAAVKQALSPSPITIDEIARSAQIGIARCTAILMELELSGEAITIAGGFAMLSID